jgi:hypothetical protein
MTYAWKFFTSVSVAPIVAAAAAIVLGAGVSFAQGMAGPAPVPGYLVGGADSQSAAAGPAGSYQGAAAGEAGGDVAVPIAGGGQVIVPGPHTQASGAGSTSRGGVWSLERTNPNSPGGVPQTGP